MTFCKYCIHFQNARIVNIAQDKTLTKKCEREDKDVQSNSQICEENFEPHKFFHCIRFNYRLAIESCMKRQDIVDYKLNLHSAFDSYCKRCRQKKEIIFINEKFNIYIPKLRRLKSKSAVMNQKDKSPPMKIKRLSSRMNQKGKSAVMKLKRVDSSLLKKKPMKIKRLSRKVVLNGKQSKSI